jgi:probable F420-dependent oxidoreductase
MELGVHSVNANGTVSPAESLALARRAEELGYQSWWAADHVVLPSPQPADVPIDPATPILDPLLHLGFVAAVTERMELGTGVVVLPQRHPLVLAKQAATLDVLSGGRLQLGVGAGWLRPELEAMGVPMNDRGRRTDEYIDAMTALWTQETPLYRGKYAIVEGVDAYPRPVHPGGPRIVIGGHSVGAYRRALSRGHGWFGNGDGPQDLEKHLADLRSVEVDRPARLGRLEITYMPMGAPITADDARRYAELGVDRLLIFTMPAQGAAGVTELLEKHVPLIGA